MYEANNIGLTTAFAANVTAFFNTFDIDWEVSRNGTQWHTAGTSRNQIYLCLADPISNPDTMFRTVVHLAVSRAGATTPAAAGDNTWNLFSNGSGPRNVLTWEGTPLYYYRKGTNFDRTMTNVQGMLQTGNGNCYAWAQLFEAALRVNGGVFEKIRAEITPTTLFFVNDWGNVGSSFFYNNSLEYDMQPPPSGPPPTGGTYGYYDNGIGAHFRNAPSVAATAPALRRPI